MKRDEMGLEHRRRRRDDNPPRRNLRRDEVALDFGRIEPNFDRRAGTWLAATGIQVGRAETPIAVSGLRSPCPAFGSAHWQSGSP
jgi:hypothetical protein